MFKSTMCTTCRTFANADIQYKGTVNPQDINYEIFSARRMPDRKFYTWTRCKSCGLLRSDPVLDINLDDLYTKSTFDYGNEVVGLKKTYLALITRHAKNLTKDSKFLEIGGGNGFVLEALVDSGFQNVCGIEPSEPAVSAARPDIRPRMIPKMLTEGLVPKNDFDVIFMFHVLDHLPDPLESLKLVHSILKDSGTFIVAVHNERSWSARILKTKSPIYDVEHTYLYSKKSAQLLFERAGFRDVSTISYKNYYSLGYMIQLIPFPNQVKMFLLNTRIFSFVHRIHVNVGLGNMVVLGIK